MNGEYISIETARIMADIEKENKELQEENERLKEIVENLTTMTVCGDKKQIKNTAQYKLEIAQDRINKAVEYINNGYLSTGEMVNILAQDELLNILQGDNNV